MLTLIRKLRRRARSDAFTAPIETGGRVVYAVGDIHGRHDLLERLLGTIIADAGTCAEAPRIVFLGDYIDRGDGARQTIDLLRRLAGQGGVEPVFLMGNHEQMLLRFLGEPSAGDRWLRYGGLQTLMSYGVGDVTILRDAEDALRVREELIEAMGAHLGFIESLRVCHQAGNVFFSHAGADPAVPTDDQEIDTLLWGCGRFHESDRADGIWVVHGHFVVDRPRVDRGRIAVDTGAYFSGRLTAARIADGEVTFLES